jgi:peptidyl-prolyl cis-trans isomerase B (cyclophilin B)
MARTLESLRSTILVTLAACLLGAGASATSYIAILADEHARSLGNGRLAQALAGPDELLAVRAALAIGRTKQAAGLPVLIAALRDRRVAVRSMALYGIGLIGGTGAAGPIADGLASENGAMKIAALDAADRCETARQLGSREREIYALVAGLLAHDSDPVVRARAAATLEAWSDSQEAPQATAALTKAASIDRSRRVRRFAMWSVFRAYAKLAPRALLVAKLHARDEIVRIEAVRAIGRRDDPSDAALLRPLLRDRSWRVQEQTEESMRLLAGKQPTAHWKQIPQYVHVPGARPDPLRALPALAAIAQAGKPRAPTVDDAIVDPMLDPKTAEAMSGPAPGPHPRVRIMTTEGNIYVVLFPEWAPLTVENFLHLAARGYYNHNRWFRIVPDFVVQTGDPHDNGNGDAGYAIPSEENPIVQDSYVISMGLNYTNPPNAHAIRDSAGAQYYITLSPQLHLDRDFTVFGRVTGGFDVFGRLTESDSVIRVERIPDQTL